MYLCVLFGSEKKERLFPYTELSGWYFNRYFTLYKPVVIICTTSLIFTNSLFYLHRVFMWFV